MQTHIRTAIQSQIVKALAKCGASVSNLQIGGFGIAMDCPTEEDATKAAEALRAAGCPMVEQGLLGGEWCVVADLPA